MIVSDTVQDYAKAIYSLSGRLDGPVPTSALAERLSVSPASASAMVRRLAELGLAEHERYGGVELTEEGEAVALGVLRHHRLLELYLTVHLDVPWDRVHQEAERLEHALSDYLVERIAAKLDDPTHDPHGDPIPAADLTIDDSPTVSLDVAELGAQGRFVRVSDSDSEMLRYLEQRGIGIGDGFEVLDRQPFDGPITVRFGRDEHVLGGALARAMRVEVG
ncbi:MAG: metal-dependent transcriptional regulator [Thermoleophilaceae bacterium]|nr:metal-dependent transcriptional regulator [Thermoleophilaceae bacterium]